MRCWDWAPSSWDKHPTVYRHPLCDRKTLVHVRTPLVSRFSLRRLSGSYRPFGALSHSPGAEFAFELPGFGATHLESSRWLGLSQRRKARIHATRPAGRKWLYRELQREGSETNASTPISSGRLRMLVKRSKLGGWTTTPANRIALLRTCLRLRSQRAPCGYQPETKIRPCPKIGTGSADRNPEDNPSVGINSLRCATQEWTLRASLFPMAR
jgi:hypothetical protein